MKQPPTQTLRDEKPECDCCKWDDMGYQHEPGCSILQNTQPQQEDWRKRVDKYGIDLLSRFIEPLHVYIKDLMPDSDLEDIIDPMVEFVDQLISTERQRVIDEVRDKLKNICRDEYNNITLTAGEIEEKIEEVITKLEEEK